MPVVHEDDALRAVRAAADMRTALAALNDELERDWGVRLESRIGVNTGEVVTGVFADHGRAIGSDDDHITQIYWRVAKAHVARHRGDRAQAARLAAEVMGLSTDYDNFDGPIAAVEIAPHLEPAAAREALEFGLGLAEKKGNIVTAARAREALAALP